MEKLLDADAVLRYLLEDIQEQSDCVAETIEAGAEVTVEVLAECVYVLSGVYHVSRSDIAESLGILLDEITCRRKRVAAAAWAFTAEVRSTSSIACWQPKFPRTDERPSHSTRSCKASLVVLRKATHARLRARRSGRDD